MWILLIIILNQPFTVDSVDILGDYADKQSCLQDQARASQDWTKTTSHHASFGCIQLNVMKTRRNAMKLPFVKMPFSIKDLDTIARVAPMIKKVFVPENEPGQHVDKVKQLEDALHDKKAEICKLREENESLKENLDNCIYTINKLRGTCSKEDRDETIR